MDERENARSPAIEHFDRVAVQVTVTEQDLRRRDTMDMIAVVALVALAAIVAAVGMVVVMEVANG